MREILFRGKRKDHGNWIFGWYCGKTCLDPFADAVESSQIIEFDELYWHEVVPETVGQFTGLTDKNGKKIFTGDIISADNGKQSCVAVVKFGEYYPKMFYKMLHMFTPGKLEVPACGFFAESVDKHEEMILFQSRCVTVIGNIHDNPELLEEGE